MKWNWQQTDWRKFTCDLTKLQHYQEQFSRLCGELIGTLKHLDHEEKYELRVMLLRDEAIQTSKIEGEYLDRDSIQSSIRQHFDLQVAKENKKTQRARCLSASRLGVTSIGNRTIRTSLREQICTLKIP